MLRGLFLLTHSVGCRGDRVVQSVCRVALTLVAVIVLFLKLKLSLLLLWAVLLRTGHNATVPFGRLRLLKVNIGLGEELGTALVYIFLEARWKVL